MRTDGHRTLLVLACTVLLAHCGGGGGGAAGGGGEASLAPQLPAPAALIARARSLELATPYVPPPGDPLEHHASGYAKVMCSSVFVTGLDPAVAADALGYFVAPVCSAPAWARRRWTASARKCGSPFRTARR